MNRLDRISAILVLLQSRSVVRAADCAERFDVSVRTVYRDIRTLEGAGVPICGDAGVGYSLVDGYRLPPLMFTTQEALAFLTAEKFIEQMTDPHTGEHFHRGMDKIRAVMRGVQKDYLSTLAASISVYRSSHTPRAKTPEALQTILQSCGRSGNSGHGLHEGRRRGVAARDRGGGRGFLQSGVVPRGVVPLSGRVP